MLFNSFSFLLFFPLVCAIYFAIPKRSQNIFLLVASYYFYMNWEPLYGALILLATVITYLAAIMIEQCTGDSRKKTLLLVFSLAITLLILVIFKYGNFIISIITDTLLLLNIKIHIPNFTLLLPVGISFFIFQALGYVIDVYRKQIKAERNFITFALFISFFPQLVAGPILRANFFMPQFHTPRSFNANNAVEGLKYMIWGYFMKVVVADRLAIYVDSVYNNAGHHSGTTFALATFFFAFQIYCDFAGYSNIALGTAKVMGFDLKQNFERPYLATNVPDFWRRWHITLSTWFRDYIYFPLGGSRRSTLRTSYNLLITFLISGLWHGANWTFIFWGGLNGVYQIFGRMAKSTLGKVKNKLRLPSIPGTYRLQHTASVLFTFILICVSWVFFRASSMAEAIYILQSIISFKGPLFTNNIEAIVYGISGIFLLTISDILQEINDGKHYFLSHANAVVRNASYIIIILMILTIGVFDSSQFIYFQF